MGSFGFEGAKGGPYLPYDFRDLTKFVESAIYTERTLGRLLVKFGVLGLGVKKDEYINRWQNCYEWLRETSISRPNTKTKSPKKKNP